jgi:hypothetical protein
MTNKEKRLLHKFIMSVARSRFRKLIQLDEKSGYRTVMVPLGTVLTKWNKTMKELK